MTGGLFGENTIKRLCEIQPKSIPSEDFSIPRRGLNLYRRLNFWAVYGIAMRAVEILV